MEIGESSRSRAEVSTFENDLPCLIGNRKFTVNFHGFVITTTVTCLPEVIETWIQETEALFNPNSSRRRIIGLTVQWPDYEYLHPCIPIRSPPVELLTLCFGNRCLMAQLPQVSHLPDNLRAFLYDSKNRFVGFNNFYDPEKLEDFSGHNLTLPLTNTRNVGDFLFDIPYRTNLMNTNFEYLYKEYQGLFLEMHRCRLTGFHSWDLWLQQVQYCTIQAYVYYKLGIDFCVADYD